MEQLNNVLGSVYTARQSCRRRPRQSCGENGLHCFLWDHLHVDGTDAVAIDGTGAIGCRRPMGLIPIADGAVECRRRQRRRCRIM